MVRTTVLGFALMVTAASCTPVIMRLLMGMTLAIGETVLKSAAGAMLNNLLDGLFVSGDNTGITVDPDNPLVGRPQQPLVLQMNNVYGQSSQELGTVRIRPDELTLVRESPYSSNWTLSDGSQRYLQQVRIFAGAQAALKARGYTPGKVDGRWGPKSRGALRSFQDAERLATTGELDQLTEARLLGY